MKKGYDVLIRPVISEKADWQRDEANVYTFEVHPRANKVDVRNAVEDVFNVKVDNVRTMVVRGKVKRVGLQMGKRKNWKKAFVTLAPEQSIDLFEGV